MKTKAEKLLSVIWAATWRSMVYLLLGFLILVLLLCAIMALVIMPIIGAERLLYGLWWQGLTGFIAWLMVIWAWRHSRLNRFFVGPPSLL